MSAAAEQLQNRLDQLRVKFAARSKDDADMLMALLDDPVPLDADKTGEIRSIAHKIAGTAALFGFGALTEPAMRLEQAVIDGVPDSEIRSMTLSFCEHMRTQTNG